MSPRVGWNFGPTEEDEYQDVVMQDPPCWTSASAVLKAGRGLSSWLFSNVSPPSSPLVSSFCEVPFSPRQLSNPVCPPQSVVPRPLYSSPRPSSINKLPQELLEEIFREYLHGPTATSLTPNYPLTGSFRRIITAAGTKTTPFTLAHVCSPWRETVMSNPSLWSRVCAFRPEPQDIPLFEFWLSRSSGHPLGIGIIQSGVFSRDRTDDVTSRILLVALERSRQWREISLQLGQNMEMLFLPSSRQISFPALKRFHLDLADWTAEGSAFIYRLLCSSPSLERASWGNMCRIPTLTSDVPWSQLCAVHLGQACLLDLQAILPIAKSLRSLSVNFLQGNGASCAPFSPEGALHILLPLLSSLTIIQYDDISPLFNILSLPSLDSITLRSGIGSTSGWTSFANLVHRSGCHISSLDWSDNALAEDVFAEEFKKLANAALPTLRQLRIRSPIGGRTVEVLTLMPSEPAPLPRLQSLELGDCTVDRVALDAMISSRPLLRRAEIVARDDHGVPITVALGTNL